MTDNRVHALREQLDQLNQQIEETRKRDRAAFLATLRDHIQTYGISERELLRAAGFLKDAPTKPLAKYYDPSSGHSWSGRGACPKWLVGRRREDYLIDRSAKTWYPE